MPISRTFTVETAKMQNAKTKEWHDVFVIKRRDSDILADFWFVFAYDYRRDAEFAAQNLRAELFVPERRDLDLQLNYYAGALEDGLGITKKTTRITHWNIVYL